MVAVDDLGGAEPARDDDAVQRRDGHDDAVDDGVGRRGHRGHKGGGIGDHQQRREPPKPDPGAGKDTRGGQQRRPPPVIGGERSKSCRDAEHRSDHQHPAGAAELGSNSAEDKANEHRRDTQPPHQGAHQ